MFRVFKEKKYSRNWEITGCSNHNIKTAPFERRQTRKYDRTMISRRFIKPGDKIFTGLCVVPLISAHDQCLDL